MLPIFKKIQLDGTDFNKEINPSKKYFGKLKPESIGDGTGHEFERGWQTINFNVYQGHCTFMTLDDIDIPLSDIKELYEIVEE